MNGTNHVPLYESFSILSFPSENKIKCMHLTYTKELHIVKTEMEHGMEKKKKKRKTQREKVGYDKLVKPYIEISS